MEIFCLGVFLSFGVHWMLPGWLQLLLATLSDEVEAAGQRDGPDRAANTTAAILVVSVIIFFCGLPIAYHAAKCGIDIDLLTRGAGFGYIGSTITSLIYASFTFIFFALEAAVMAYALELAFDIPPAWGYLLCALVMVAFAVAMSLNERIRWNDASLGALVAAFPNTGFMGVPLLAALIGPSSVGPVIVMIIVDMVVTSSLCIALSRLDGADEHGASRAAKSALKGVLTNPMPWAISLGGLSSAMDWQLVGPVAKTVGLLADAASPVALFTIGAVLARTQIRVNESGHAPIVWRDYLPVSVFKLVLHPVLVLLVLAATVQLGFHIERFSLLVVVLVAALPSASNVALLSERFDADTGRIARIILVTTAAAFLTFSGAVALLFN